MTKEQAITQYIEKLQITREQAEQLWEDDQEDYIGEEGEQMTEKAKQIKRYEQAEKPKKKVQKERKVDLVKKEIIDELVACISKNVGKVTKVKTETEIDFVYANEDFTLKLTRHRKKKE